MNRDEGAAGREIVRATPAPLAVLSNTLVGRGLALLAQIEARSVRASDEEISPEVLRLLEPLGRNLQSGRPEYRHKTTGIVLVHIPAGEFWMGSPEDEPYRGEDERRHRVRITKPYLLGKHEVTSDQFREQFPERPHAIRCPSAHAL